VRASRYTRYRLDPVFDRTPDGAVIDLEWLTWLGTEDYICTAVVPVIPLSAWFNTCRANSSWRDGSDGELSPVCYSEFTHDKASVCLNGGL
jgi:hypothetical protein